MGKVKRTEQEIRVRLSALPEDPILGSFCKGALDPAKSFAGEGSHEDHGWCANRNYDECHCECPCHWAEARFRLGVYGSAYD